MSSLRVRELTPRGRGGVSVVALEGADALERVLALCPAPRAPLAVGDAPRLVRLAARDDETLDEALVVVLSAERVELHLHGSPPLVRRVRTLLGDGERPTPARTLEERAAELLASAPCEDGARLLLDQAEGALRRELEALGALEAAAQDPRLETLLERGRVARHALEASRVVLAGPVNAGKSTLFNALFGARRVVTSASAGTTRDVIVERARLGPWPVDLVDAPGERAAGDAGADAGRRLERAGLDLARELVEGADLVLWLAPASAPPAPDAWAGDGSGAPRVVLTSLADRLAPGERAAREPAVSALEDPAGAVRRVERLFVEHLELAAPAWEPGAATPFEPGQLEALRAIRAERDPAARARLLVDLLDPAPPGGPAGGPNAAARVDGGGTSG